KRFLILLLFLLLNHGLLAQEGKSVVAILPFRSDYGAGSQADQNNIAEMVAQSAVSTGRFTLFNEDRLKQYLAENKVAGAPGDSANTIAYINLCKSLGVHFLVAGNIKNISTKPTTDILGKTAYTAHVIFSLKLIDVMNEKTRIVKEFDSYGLIGGYVNMSYETEQNAILKTIQGLKRQVTTFFNDQFSVSFALVDVLREKKGEAERVQLLGGKNLGLSKNMKLKVLRVSVLTYNGREVTRRKQVGTLNVVEIQGEEVSEAEVLEGGKDILAAFKEDPKCLVCETQ
ncbi:MAG TPA: hypothetical protein PKG48_03945, partial [Bacteroidales bacterium]|nr:hypothetical protein [Bacteroidales bacterium]